MIKVKTIIKTIVFLILGILMFQVLTMIFVPKWMSKIDPATPRIKGYYLEEENTIDVLAIGNSDVGRGFSPIALWKEYGITSYNLGTSNQTMAMAYYLIKEAIQYQDVKMIVLDMDATFDKKNAPDGEYRKLFDNMKMGKIKYEAILDQKLDIEDRLSFALPLLRFHSRWSELKTDDFRITKKYNKSVSYKGMAMSNEVKPYIDKKDYMKDTGKIEEIPEIQLIYIKKIVELCREENIKLLWVELPSASSWSSAKSKAITKLAEENQVEFIDMNYYLEGFDFNWKTDTADKGNHLNVQGAEKVSKYIGNVLKEKYHLEDHRNDVNYEGWNEETKRYEKNKESDKNNKPGKANNLLKNK